MDTPKSSATPSNTLDADLAPPSARRLYRHPVSGHCHRVELLLAMLKLPYEKIHVDLTKGAQKHPDFLAKNPFGQVPVLEDAGLTLFDSNAILVYLATRYDRTRTWLPQDPTTQARIQQWLSVAAGPLAYGPAAARLVVLFGAKLDHEGAKETSRNLFLVADKHLTQRSFLVGDGPTIADLALYTYVARAPQGEVAIEPYEHVGRWLSRVEALPEFFP